jgi:hypothetical protein
MKDAIQRVKTPEFHSAVVEPLFAYLLDLLFPYLVAIVGLWFLTFLGVAAILIFLVHIVT